MTKTRLDVCSEALWRIGVAPHDEEPTAPQYERAGNILDGMFASLKSDPHNMPFTWDLDATPDEAFLPLAWLLSVPLAGYFAVQAPESWAMAMGRLRAYAFPNDMPLLGDLDEDGTVTEAEEYAASRAAYF